MWGRGEGGRGEGKKMEEWQCYVPFLKGGGGRRGWRWRGSRGEVCVLDLIVVVLLLGLKGLG